MFARYGLSYERYGRSQIRNQSLNYVERMESPAMEAEKGESARVNRVTEGRKGGDELRASGIDRHIEEE